MSGSSQWEVVRGFGDMGNMAECFDVQRYKQRFESEAGAEAFAELHYEQRVKRLMKTMPDWWKSFWVKVRKVTK